MADDLITQATKAVRREMKRVATDLLATRAVAVAKETRLRSAIISWVKIGGSGEQGRFADEVGASKAYMSEICNGGRGIGDDLARKIAGLK